MPEVGEDIVLSIANNALHLIGHNGITSIHEDTKEGKLCKFFYAVAKAATLRSHPWNSATVREMVPEVKLEEMPSYEAKLGYLHVYQLPPTCLRVLQVDENVRSYNHIWWKVEGRRLYTTTPIAYVTYIADIDDINDPMLMEAIIYKLAAALAYPITGDVNMAATYSQLYELKIREARAIDGQEGKSDTLVNNVLTNARQA
jgi:hypothetical protein